jgi:hypothetical protein
MRWALLHEIKPYQKENILLFLIDTHICMHLFERGLYHVTSASVYDPFHNCTYAIWLVSVKRVKSLVIINKPLSREAL